MKKVQEWKTTIKDIIVFQTKKKERHSELYEKFRKDIRVSSITQKVKGMKSLNLLPKHDIKFF